jgi:hypothetical protein
MHQWHSGLELPTALGGRGIEWDGTMEERSEGWLIFAGGWIRLPVPFILIGSLTTH